MPAYFLDYQTEETWKGPAISYRRKQAPHILLNRQVEQRALKSAQKGGDLIDCEGPLKSGMFCKQLLHS